MTGFVYAFRYGDGYHVKIGKTNDLNRRRKALQVAHHNPLVLADCIEHDEYLEGEKYVHGLLAVRQVRQAGGVGSREHFVVGDAELAEAFEKTRKYLNTDLVQQRELTKYEALEAGEEILPATDDIQWVKDRLAELRSIRARLQPEKDNLDEEVRELQKRQSAERERLNRLFQEVDAEEDRLVTIVKLAIGPAAGIDGVATWESVADNRRHFDQEWLKADAPDLFETYRTAFDGARFRREQRAAYEAHMRITTHREFQWVDDDYLDNDCPNDEKPAPNGDNSMPSRDRPAPLETFARSL